jgi:hypothetical protein
MCARPHVRRHRISRLHPDRGGGTGAPRGCADVDAVYQDCGTPQACAIQLASPEALERYSFAGGAAGTMIARNPSEIEWYDGAKP